MCRYYDSMILHLGGGHIQNVFILQLTLCILCVSAVGKQNKVYLYSKHSYMLSVCCFVSFVNFLELALTNYEKKDNLMEA